MAKPPRQPFAARPAIALWKSSLLSGGKPFHIAVTPERRTLSFASLAEARRVAGRLAAKNGWRLIDQIDGNGGRRG